jgi:hypothetical protein
VWACFPFLRQCATARLPDLVVRVRLLRVVVPEHLVDDDADKSSNPRVKADA